MSLGFTLVTSYAIKAGDVIKFILSNPLAALCIGIIATALMQNATATTSIAVIMVGAGIIPDVKSAVPIIMGSNIGTCVTNSFIALTLVGDPQMFKRAFSAATLNDGFNLMTTAILLPIEIVSGFLFIISDKVTNMFPLDNPAALSSFNFINAILNPVTDLFIVLNGTAVNLISSGDKSIKDVSLRCCKQDVANITQFDSNNYNFTSSTTKIFNLNTKNFSNILNSTNNCLEECNFWCMPMLKAFGDGGTGLFWIIFSLVVLLTSLFGIVKVLGLLIVGPIAKAVTKALNASFPGKFKWLTQLLLFIVSFFLTIMVQSSNIITATLVPLCGIGIISLQKVYVMTLGSNIGTTVTGLLTAFAQPASSVKKAMQLAFVYTFFNTLGVLFWLPIPFLRYPKRYATKLGNTVFFYRWFLYVYVCLLFFLIPVIIFGLALVPNWIGLSIIGIPVIILIFSFIIIFYLQNKFNHILPRHLKSFDWAPAWIRSLEPLDRQLRRLNIVKEKNSKISFSESKNELISTKINSRTTIKDNQPWKSTLIKLRVMNGLVEEAKKYTTEHSIRSDENSSDEDFHDHESNKNPKIQNSSESDHNRADIVTRL
jgi:sodium-dependent phosphate cotransporter